MPAFFESSLNRRKGGADSQGPASLHPLAVPFSGTQPDLLQPSPGAMMEGGGVMSCALESDPKVAHFASLLSADPIWIFCLFVYCGKLYIG